MNTGKTLFAQVMEFVPWKTFSQLTWRESLRDIEACLAANSPKLFHMGLRSAPARARALYDDERVLADLDAAVYALDSTTIYAQRHYPEHHRRIRYRDPKTAKTLVFLTNNTVLDAATICI